MGLGPGRRQSGTGRAAWLEGTRPPDAWIAEPGQGRAQGGFTDGLGQDLSLPVARVEAGWPVAGREDEGHVARGELIRHGIDVFAAAEIDVEDRTVERTD